MNRKGKEKFLGFEVDEETGEINALCACDECVHGGNGEGHFMCYPCPESLIESENEGRVERIFDDGWKWVYIQ